MNTGDDAALPRYGIDETAQKCGIPAATMRVWEQRYGWPQPERNESGYRLYSEAQIADLTRLKALLDKGFSLRDVIMDGAPRWPSEQVPRPERPHFETNDLPDLRTPFAKKIRDRLIEAVLTNDVGTVDWAVNQAPLIKPVERRAVYVSVFERAGQPVPEALLPLLPAPTADDGVVRRGRGRPRRLPLPLPTGAPMGATATTGASGTASDAGVPPVRRGPGRPRKHPLPVATMVVAATGEDPARPAPRRGRGRPPIANETSGAVEATERQARIAALRDQFAAARRALAVLTALVDDELVVEVHQADEHEREAVAVALDLVRR